MKTTTAISLALGLFLSLLMPGANALGQTIVSVSPATGPTQGGIPLTISGSNFGATVGTVKIGLTVCTVTSWTSTTINCILPAGQGAGLPLVVTPSGGGASAPFLFSYNAPVIVSVSPASAPTSGGTSIEIVGSNFGTNGAVTVGGVPCSVTQWTHTKITCLVPAGQGAGQPVLVTAGGQVSNAGNFSYAPPFVSSITPASDPTPGGSLLTISGSSFGTNGTVTLGGTPCNVASWTHTQIVIIIPAGQGLNVPLVVTVAGQSSPVFTGFSYSAPVISAITPASGPTSGGMSFTITGSNFGTTGAVTVGGVVCPVTQWSHTQIVCLTPGGQGAGKPVVVTVAGQTSNVGIFSYNPPFISSITPASGLTAGGTTLAISGASFGTNGMVTLGGASCGVSSWTHTQIVVTTPPGQGTNVPLVVTVSGQSSQLFTGFSYYPLLLGISPTAGGLALRWPVSAADYSLEWTSTLEASGTAWNPAPWPRTTNAGMIEVVAPVNPANAFFRLGKP